MNGQQAGLLTQNMSPEQARLLDQQLRQKQFQGKNFGGGGALGNFLTSASGAIQGAAGAGQGVAERFGAKRSVGANEQQAMKSQEAMQAKQQRIQQQLQGKSPEQLAVIERNALAAGQKELAEAAKSIRDTYTQKEAKYLAPTEVMDSQGNVQPVRFNTNSGNYESLKDGTNVPISSVTVNSRKMGELDAGVVKMINTVQTEAEVSQMDAMSLTDIAERIKDEDNYTVGVFGRIEQTVKDFLGMGDDETLTKKDFQKYAQREGLKLLPPGSTSNVEFLTALSTVPEANSSKQVILGWLAANAKLAAMETDFKKYKAQFMADNGGLSVGAIDSWQKSLDDNKRQQWFGEGKPKQIGGFSVEDILNDPRNTGG